MKLLVFHLRNCLLVRPPKEARTFTPEHVAESPLASGVRHISRQRLSKNTRLQCGESCFSRNYFRYYCWKSGVILRLTGPVPYDEQVNNSVDYRHVLQLRPRLSNIDHSSKEKKINGDVKSVFNASERQEQEQAAQPAAQVKQ